MQSSLSFTLPATPAQGQWCSLPQLHGSSDAFAVAALGLRAREEGRLLLVLCASAQIAQRLSEELRWAEPTLNVDLFPDWETLPYDHFSPHQDLVSERLLALYRLLQQQTHIFIAPITTASHRLAPLAFHAAHTFSIATGQKFNLEAMRAQLTLAGYAHVTQVVAPGEYCVRGGLIDLYPMGAALPFRIDLFDDEIESIKQFNTESQRTLFPVKEIRLLPAREFPTDESARTFFRKKFREVFEGDPSRCALYKDIGNGVIAGGIEYYTPLFFEHTTTLFDYVGSNTITFEHGDLAGALAQFEADTQARYKLLRGDTSRSCLPPAQLFVPKDDFLHGLKRFARFQFRADAADTGLTKAAPDIAVDRKAGDLLEKLKRVLDRPSAPQVVLCAESNGRRETLADLLREHAISPQLFDSLDEATASTAKFALITSPLYVGFENPAARIIVVTETELYATTARRAQRKRNAQSNVDGMLKDLAEVKVGDPVVHQEHGIGRYCGLVSLDMGEGASEFLHIDYANEAKLYVPVGSLHLISRYSGTDPEHAPLHTLGSGAWEKAKKRAAAQARDTAAELLNLYAQRAARKGMSCKFDAHSYEAFAAGFPFEETPDQSAAIHAVIQDLISDRPMDRLVCGDVGFGKTEVALRAAFVALMDERQVAVLVHLLQQVQ